MLTEDWPWASRAAKAPRPAAIQGIWRAARRARRRPRLFGESVTATAASGGASVPGGGLLAGVDVLLEKPRHRVAVEAHDRVSQVAALPGLEAARRLEILRDAHTRPGGQRAAGEQRRDGRLELARASSCRRPRTAPPPFPSRSRRNVVGIATTSKASPAFPDGSRTIEKVDRDLVEEGRQRRRRPPRASGRRRRGPGTRTCAGASRRTESSCGRGRTTRPRSRGRRPCP